MQKLRKTKIVCTIGPSSQDENTFKELVLNGLNVARLNFSHGNQEEHKAKIDVIKKSWNFHSNNAGYKRS